MKTKPQIILLAFFISLFSYSQQLTYKTGGRIYDSENMKLPHSKVRELLKKHPQSLKSYNEGILKQNAGNLFIAAGVGFIIGDLTSGLYGTSPYPRAATYIGLTTLLVAIPIKIGFSKKMQTAVDEYNKAENNKTAGIRELDIISNKNGIGLAISF